MVRWKLGAASKVPRSVGRRPYRIGNISAALSQRTRCPCGRIARRLMLKFRIELRPDDAMITEIQVQIMKPIRAPSAP